MESEDLSSLFADDKKVFTEVKASIANFWLRDEFSATVINPVASGKSKLAIKDSVEFKTITLWGKPMETKKNMWIKFTLKTVLFKFYLI